MNPVCVSTWGEPQKYFNYFMATAKKNGIEPINADPEVWPGGTDWRLIPWWRKSHAQAEFIRKYGNLYTHYLFCDAYDIVFAAGWEEIIEKFKSYNSPIVFGTERNCWPDLNLASKYPESPYPTRFLNAGFWIAETDAALKFAEVLEQKAQEKTKCDSGICVDLFLSGQHPIELDRDCRLFFCCNMDSLNYVKKENGRVVNTQSGQCPCLFHGNGASDLMHIIKLME